MPVDLRCKHDREVRERAADLFAAGRGSKSVARELRVPEGAVRKWLLTYRAVGREALLGMGKSHTVCLGRVCANVLEGGMGLENIPIATWAIWALAAATSVIFICYLMYSSKLSNRLFDVSVAERSQDDALPEASPPTESSIDRVVKKYGLSEREAQIIRDYSVGRTVRYIADWNMLSEHTVKTHLRRAYTKMNIHSRQELLDKIDEAECDILQGR